MGLLLITDHFLPHRGGSRVYYHELLSRMREEHVCILTRAQPGDREFDKDQSYQVERCRLEESAALAPFRMQQIPLYQTLLRRGSACIRRLQPSVLLAGELAPTGVVAAHLAQAHSLPLILFTHAEGPATLARTRLQSRLCRWACGRARTIVAASENAQRSLREDLGVAETPVDILLPGVAEAHFAPEWQARPFSQGAFRLLTVGRLIPRKGHASVLRAVAALKQSLPRLRYQIIGAGPEEQRLRKLVAELGLQGVVQFAGKVTDEEMLQAYRESDCFILPNRDDPITGDTEGFGIVFGEAAAHGLPVIGGAAGGTSHSILHGKTGLRVDGEKEQAIIDALKKLADAPEAARRMGAKGRELARSAFRWEQRAEDFRDILKRRAGLP